MDIDSILREMKTHRDRLDIAIRSLEELALGEKPPPWETAEVEDSCEALRSRTEDPVV